MIGETLICAACQFVENCRIVPWSKDDFKYSGLQILEARPQHGVYALNLTSK